MNQVSPSRGRSLDRSVGVGAEPDRRVRLLHRFERERRVLESEVGARHGDAVLGPEANHRLQVLLQPRDALGLCGAKTLELHLAIAESCTEYHAPAGHHIEGRDLLGDIEWFVQREQDDPRQQAAARRLDHEPRQQRDLLILLQGVGGVVHAGGENVEAEFVREPRLGAEVREARVHVLAAAELAADEETVLHGAPQSAAGSCESVRRQSSSSGSIADQSRVQ